MYPGRTRRRVGEVGHGATLRREQPALDLSREHRAAPAVGDGLLGVPEALPIVLQLLEEPHVVAPGQFRNKLLHN